jgi:ABC-2 type transport system permease protein
MVAQLLGLKLRLLGNLFRRSAWHVVGLVVSLIYGLGIAVLLATALVGLRFVPDVDVVRDGLVIAGAIVLAGFVVVPLFFGSDDSMDPRRFALFGTEERPLALGLAVTSLIGVPALVTAIVMVGWFVTWTRDPLSTILGLLSAVIALATCMLAARVSTTLAALLLATRRAREVSAIIGIVALVLVSPVVVLLVQIDWETTGRDLVAGFGQVLAWTPFGAVWAFPADAAAGDIGLALVRLAIAALTLGLLWLAWERLVAVTLVTPGRQAQSHAYRGIGWFDRVPPGQTGAVAARSITYWLRDSRYWVSLVMIPVLPVLLVVPLAAVHVPSGVLALLPVPVMCVFLGWTVHNDVAYDSSAIWLHVASGVSGFADRIGRLVPALLLAVPLIAAGTIVSLSLYGDWSVLPSFVGICTCLLLVGLGCGSYTSARFPYPVPKPGASPFAQPQSSGTAAAAVQSVTFIIAIGLSLPAMGFAALALLVDPQWHLAAFVYGIAVGLIALVAGVWWGARTFARRGPEILAAALRA